MYAPTLDAIDVAMSMETFAVVIGSFFNSLFKSPWTILEHNLGFLVSLHRSLTKL
ncbi:hypothetical protein Fmac_016156 [Flemingia macrophylla]|uniref:Uncharacterized protein n=1 Tax=Flemingia macrophylla TaxID=520843 RepID=A0ABD1MGM6_9FABA